MDIMGTKKYTAVGKPHWIDTDRQYQIVALLLEGLSVSEISEEVGVKVGKIHSFLREGLRWYGLSDGLNRETYRQLKEAILNDNEAW